MCVIIDYCFNLLVKIQLHKESGETDRQRFGRRERDRERERGDGRVVGGGGGGGEAVERSLHTTKNKTYPSPVLRLNFVKGD